VPASRVHLPARLAAAASHPGREREINEDRVLADPESGIFAVIDGVGGESAGEVAAQTALEVLRARLSRRTTDLDRLVREAIALANKQIWERAQTSAEYHGMACVLTVAVLDGDRATVGHVGDSRLYLLRRGEIRKVTPDHSPVGAREDAGEISEAEAMRHPRRNEIFRDVGSAPHEPDDEGFIDILQIPFRPDEALLLCSDGLSDLVTSREILDVVERHAGDPEAATQVLIDRANEEGGKDNISIVIVQGDDYAASLRRRPAAAPRGASDSALETGARRSPYGAARAASSSGPGRVLEALGSRAAWSIYVLAAALLALYLFQEPVLSFVRDLAGTPPDPAPPPVLRVGVGDGGLPTIGEALARAQPGQTIEVAPGVYPETVRLKSGVFLVSLEPHGAVITGGGGGGGGTGAGGAPAVIAEGVRGGRLMNFLLAPPEGAALAVGLRLADSEITVEGIKVTGATVAGVDIGGNDRSTLRYVVVQGNPGIGVIVANTAAPHLTDNLIANNGTTPGALGPGIEVRDTARPRLTNNKIEGNGGPGILLATSGSEEEYLRWNNFGATPRDRTVQVGGR
jgi:parallel beta-helix repeat protein